MSNDPPSEVHVVRSRSALEALADEWDVLAEMMGMPMLSHAWVLACAEAFYTDDELCIITVRRQGELAAIAPLVMIRRTGVSRLELIGVSYLYEPSGVLYRDDKALASLINAIVGCGLPVVFARMPSDSPAIPQLRSVISGFGIVLDGGVGYSLTVPVSSGWDTYLARLSSRRRYDLRRARRRAEEVGTVTVKIVSLKPAEIEDGIAEFARIESTGWKDRNGSSLSLRARLRTFFLRYATLASESGSFRFAFLAVEGKPIAAQLSVVYAERFWVLKISYDEAWSRCSPGWQLLAATIEHAFESKLKSYEFLGSDEPWLHGWISERRAYRTVGCYPATIRGMCGLAVDTAGRIGGRVAARLR